MMTSASCSWCGKKLGAKHYAPEPMTSPYRAYGHAGYYHCPTCKKDTFPPHSHESPVTLDNYFDLDFDGR